MTVLERLPDSARVAIVRLRSLGDCVLTTPAIDLLNRSRPDLKIAVVVEQRFAPVFEGNSAISEILPPSISAVRNFGAELCVNLHGGTRSAGLTLASGARFRAGFAHFRFAGAYNTLIPRAQEILGVERVMHTAEHLASAMFFLGAERMEIPRARLSAIRRANSTPYAVIHAVASDPSKTWPADRFLSIAERLGMEPVFIAGPGEDLASFQKYRTVIGAPLSELKNLLANASLFVGNDSGPAHIAAAFGLPLVVLFGSSNPDIWRPWKTAAETLIGVDGISSISIEQVLASVTKLRVHA